MSRVVYFDCASGASGDMLLGALVDLGMSLDDLRAELQKLPLRGFRLESHRVHRSGLHATKVDVVLEHEHGHGHRGLAEILEILEKGGLDAAVGDRAAALFRRLAEAEASVHGQSVDEVHFHEVGAVDAIVDVVGGCFGLAWLKADRFVSSPLNLGTGTVSMSHGIYPVPPPATARLVAGVPVYGSGDGELLTPTGALLVTGHATSYGPLPPLTLQGVGNGAGSREIPGRPNVLRLLVGEDAVSADSERVMVLECEIDDMSPQLCGPLLDRLFAGGALDAFFTAVTMKKGRPGLLVSVLCPPERYLALEEVLFAETTTLGVRRQEWDRTVLAREQVQVVTAYGSIGVKLGRRNGRVYNAQPEFEECQRAAVVRGVPVKEVWAAALSAWRAKQGS